MAPPKTVSEQGEAVGRMATALLIGSAVGVLLGLFHAGYVYRRELADTPDAWTGPVATRLRAGYSAFF